MVWHFTRKIIIRSVLSQDRLCSYTMLALFGTFVFSFLWHSLFSHFFFRLGFKQNLQVRQFLSVLQPSHSPQLFLLGFSCLGSLYFVTVFHCPSVSFCSSFLGGGVLGCFPLLDSSRWWTESRLALPDFESLISVWTVSVGSAVWVGMLLLVVNLTSLARSAKKL